MRRLIGEVDAKMRAFVRSIGQEHFIAAARELVLAAKTMVSGRK